MQVHIALYRWKPEAQASWIEVAMESIEALADKIPGIIDISTGRNTSPYGEGYTHVILVRGRDGAAIEAYRQHPDHLAAARLIEQLEEHGIGVDFSSR